MSNKKEVINTFIKTFKESLPQSSGEMIKDPYKKNGKGSFVAYLQNWGDNTFSLFLTNECVIEKLTKETVENDEFFEIDMSERIHIKGEYSETTFNNPIYRNYIDKYKNTIPDIKSMYSRERINVEEGNLLTYSNNYRLDFEGPLSKTRAKEIVELMVG